MSDENQEPTADLGQIDAWKKIDVPANVHVGQATGYDPQEYASKTVKHAELLERFGVQTYGAFEQKLGSPFASAVVAFLLGDADHARVLGNTLVRDEPSAAPGGVKADFDGDADSTLKHGGQDIAVKDGLYFVNGYKFVEKRHADLYASSLDNPTETTV